MRPDRVYRTSVLQAMYGFNPVQDVMDNAQDFTMGPYAFQQGSAGQALNGPPAMLYGSGFGWLQKLWLKLKASFAKAKAQRFMLQGLGSASIDPYGPQEWAGSRVVPDPVRRVGMLLAMQEKTQPREWASRNTDQLALLWNARRGVPGG